MVVLNREETDVTRLTEAEWSDLRRYLRRVTAALDSLFQPDTYNFAFLMNEDRWVHLHVVPRYESPREWAGERFEDPHFGSLFGAELRLLDADALLRLGRAVAAAVEGERLGGTLPTEESVRVMRGPTRFAGVLSLAAVLALAGGGAGGGGTAATTTTGEDLVIGVPMSITGSQSKEGGLAKQGYDRWLQW